MFLKNIQNSIHRLVIRKITLHYITQTNRIILLKRWKLPK